MRCNLCKGPYVLLKVRNHGKQVWTCATITCNNSKTNPEHKNTLMN